jgi:hypothetical protein
MRSRPLDDTSPSMISRPAEAPLRWRVRMIFRVDATAGAPMFSWSGQRSRPATPRHFAQALQTLPARRAEILWRNASIPCDFRNPAAAGGSMPDVIVFGLQPTNSGSRAPALSPDTVLTEVQRWEDDGGALPPDQTPGTEVERPPVPIDKTHLPCRQRRGNLRKAESTSC